MVFDGVSRSSSGSTNSRRGGRVRDGSGRRGRRFRTVFSQRFAAILTTILLSSNFVEFSEFSEGSGLTKGSAWETGPPGARVNRWVVRDGPSITAKQRQEG